MNDFLRPCNCVHPSDEECDKCVAEAAAETPAQECCGKCDEAKPEADAPKA